MKKIKAVYAVLNTIYRNNKQGATAQEISKRLEELYYFLGVTITPDDVYGIIEYHIQQGFIGKLTSWKEPVGMKNDIKVKYHKYFVTEKGVAYAEKKYGIKQWEEEPSKKTKRFAWFAVLLIGSVLWYLLTK